MTIFVGDDWAETHHDVHLMNETGDRLAAKRLPERLEGIAGLHALIAEYTTDPGEVIVGIETERGMHRPRDAPRRRRCVGRCWFGHDVPADDRRSREDARGDQRRR